MPSAKIVAQNPAGNLSPLSVSGHAAIAACAAVVALSAGAEKPAAQIAKSTAITNHEFLYRASGMVLHLTELTHRTRHRRERRCGAILIFVAPMIFQDCLPDSQNAPSERSCRIAFANRQGLRRQLRSVHDNLAKATVSGAFYRAAEFHIWRD